MLLRRETPCHGCTEETGRSLTCHGTCERYKEFTSGLRKEKEKIIKLKNKEHTFYKGFSDKKTKALKRKAKKPR